MADPREPASALGRRALHDDDAPNFTRTLGIQRVLMEGGRCEIRLPLRPDHLNLGGVVHGGVTTAILDSCMGGAVVSTLGKGEWCGTAQLDTKFLRWGEGSVLTCSAHVVKRGRALAFVEGVVKDAKGKEVARASGVWFIWNEAERPSGPPEGA
jgi:uncharacterized protein (TIGR00369 family)